MEPTKEELTERLVSEVRHLPEDKILAILHFAGYLRTSSGLRPQDPERRGSAAEILQALDQAGPLRFDPGELDALLADIEHMREADLQERG